MKAQDLFPDLDRDGDERFAVARAEAERRHALYTADRMARGTLIREQDSPPPERR